MHPSRIALYLLVWLPLADQAAALEWTSTLAEPEVLPGQETIEAVFPFINAGDRPVTILTVESECGCTTAELAKKTYAPGEGGEIKAVFIPGARVGRQEKIITVKTDAPGEAVELRLQVEIPLVFEVNPRVVYWSRGEEPLPKIVFLRINPDSKLQVQQVESDHPDMVSRWEALEEANTYKLVLQPKSTDQPLKANVRIATAAAHSAAPTPGHTVFAHVFP